jgi:hypothetical protein
MSNRPVKRVLVMLEYGDGESDNGEVFDLTALVREMGVSSKYGRAGISLNVDAEKIYNYDRKATEPAELAYRTSIRWGGDAGEWVHGATHLDDVINAALPDGERVQRIKRASGRAKKRMESLARDAMVAKLEQVAAIRYQHPIARVTETAKQLAEVVS